MEDDLQGMSDKGLKRMPLGSDAYALVDEGMRVVECYNSKGNLLFKQPDPQLRPKYENNSDD